MKSKTNLLLALVSLFSLQFSHAQDWTSDSDFDPSNKGILDLSTGQYRNHNTNEAQLIGTQDIFVIPGSNSMFLHARFVLPSRAPRGTRRSLQSRIYHAEYKGGDTIEFEEYLQTGDYSKRTIQLSGTDIAISKTDDRNPVPQIDIQSPKVHKLNGHAFFSVQTEDGVLLRNLANQYGLGFREINDLWALTLLFNSSEHLNEISKIALLRAIEQILLAYPKLAKYRHLNQLALDLVNRQRSRIPGTYQAADRVVHQFMTNSPTLRDDSDQCLIPFGSL